MAKQIKWVTPDTRLDSLNTVFDRISGVPVVKSNADMTLVSSTAIALRVVWSASLPAMCLSAMVSKMNSDAITLPCRQSAAGMEQPVGGPG